MTQKRHDIPSRDADALLNSRRLFLRQCIAGASAIIPSALPSLAAAQHVGSSVGSPGAGPAPDTIAMAQGKISKPAAAYQDSPKGDQRCGGCAFFRAPDQCGIVEGPISPSGWCRHFKAA